MPASRKSSQRQTRMLSVSGFQTRSNSDGTVTFSGYASTFNEPYDMGYFTEVVRSGAFTKTLSQDPDVRFLANHEGLPMARTTAGTLSLSQDDVGLLVEATLNVDRSDVNDMVIAMRDGALTQMSFAFRIIQETWSPDYTQCDLIELALDGGDVSVVTYPANPTTSAGVRAFRSAMQNLTPDEARSLYAEIDKCDVSDDNKTLLRALLSAMTDNGDAVVVPEQREAVADAVVSEPAADAPVVDEAPAERTTSLALAQAQAEALRLRA